MALETQLRDFPETTALYFNVLMYFWCVLGILIRFIVKFMPDKEPQPQITYAAPPPVQAAPAGTVVAAGGQAAGAVVPANTPAPAAG